MSHVLVILSLHSVSVYTNQQNRDTIFITLNIENAIHARKRRTKTE